MEDNKLEALKSYGNEHHLNNITFIEKNDIYWF